MEWSASASDARPSSSSPRVKRMAARYFIQNPYGLRSPISSASMVGRTVALQSPKVASRFPPEARRPRSCSTSIRRMVPASEPTHMWGLAPSAKPRRRTPRAPARSRASTALPSAKKGSEAVRATTASTSATPIVLRSPTNAASFATSAASARASVPTSAASRSSAPGSTDFPVPASIPASIGPRTGRLASQVPSLFTASVMRHPASASRFTSGSRPSTFPAVITRTYPGGRPRSRTRSRAETSSFAAWRFFSPA